MAANGGLTHPFSSQLTKSSHLVDFRFMRSPFSHPKSILKGSLLIFAFAATFSPLHYRSESKLVDFLIFVLLFVTSSFHSNSTQPSAQKKIS
jgi:hypothetical protein